MVKKVETLYWGFIYPRRGRSQGTVIAVGGALVASRLAGVLIWFVTSLTGGFIHLKLIGRNPLVGSDAHRAPRSSVVRFQEQTDSFFR